MKRSVIAFLLIVSVLSSCITKDGYKETDLFEEFETEQGFGVFHIPPILFRIVFSLADETEAEQLVSKDVLDKIDVIKVLFFEEQDNSKPIKEVKDRIAEKIKAYNYNLLTRIAQEETDISIYIIDHEQVIREVLITFVVDNQYICFNVVGELTQDEVMKIYKSVNINEIVNYSN